MAAAGWGVKGWKVQRAVYTAITRDLARYGLPPKEPSGIAPIERPIYARDKRAAARVDEQEQLRARVRAALAEEGD